MERIKSYIGLILTVITLVGALFAFDARYAHAEDTKKEISQTQVLVERSTNNLRRSLIEDKGFEIEVKQAQAKKPDPIDAAIKARYLRQLSEIPKDETPKK